MKMASDVVARRNDLELRYARSISALFDTLCAGERLPATQSGLRSLDYVALARLDKVYRWSMINDLKSRRRQFFFDMADLKDYYAYSLLWAS